MKKKSSNLPASVSGTESLDSWKERIRDKRLLIDLADAAYQPFREKIIQRVSGVIDIINQLSEKSSHSALTASFGSMVLRSLVELQEMEAGYILRTMIDHCDALDPDTSDATVTTASQAREWFEDLLRSFGMDLPTELFDGREIIEFHLPNMVGFMEARDDEGNAVDASPRFSVGNRIDWKMIQIEAFAKFGILIGENPRAKSFSHLLKAMAVNDKQKHSDLMPMQERLDDLIDMYEARIALDLGVNVPRKGLSKLAGVSEKAVINAALNGELSCTEKSKKEYTNSTALAWLKSPKRRQKYFETLSFPEAGKDESVKSVVALDHANDLIKFTRAIDFIKENEQIVIDKVPVNELL